MSKDYKGWEFAPEFIPVYLEIRKKYGTSFGVTVLYGYLRTFVVGTGADPKEGTHLWVTNKQMADFFNCSICSIEKRLNILKEKKLIELTSRRNKSEMIRFIKILV